jgi:hypoxanthine phosphoribosyltransferase
MSITAQQAWQVYQQAERLFSLHEVEAALDRMAEAVSERLSDSDPVVLTVMNGGLQPAARLLSRLDFPLRQDYVHVSRYRERTHGTDLQWLHRPNCSLAGRTVLIVDDILDEGYTLEALIANCQSMGAKTVQSALLCEKGHGRGADIEGTFVALQVPDRYVFGYGMDYKGYLRNAPGIFAALES